MIAEVRAGAEQAGRNPADVDIAIYLRICVTEDEDKALESFKRELAGYAFVDAYNEMFARYGLGDQFAEVRKLWREGKRDDRCDPSQHNEPPRPRRSGWWQRARATVIGK